MICGRCCRPKAARSSSPPSRSSGSRRTTGRDRASRALGPVEHHRHRRRGAPLAVRLHRRATPAIWPMRCPTPGGSASPARRSASRGADTVEVFGDVIHTYDIQQSQEDQATVPIYYAPRQIKLHLSTGGHRRGAERTGREHGRHRPGAPQESLGGAGRGGRGQGSRGGTGPGPAGALSGPDRDA